MIASGRDNFCYNNCPIREACPDVMFDLAQLDPLPVKLHLGIAATDKPDFAATCKLHEITCPVQSRGSGVITEVL